jgi:hypothetical protein
MADFYKDLLRYKGEQYIDIIKDKIEAYANN